MKFIGSVYAYFRLGGKSKQRGLHGSHDFSILPMEAVALEAFKPGIDARYENQAESSDSGGTIEEKGGGDPVGESSARRSKHSHSRHRNNGSSSEGPEDKDRKSINDQRQKTSRSRRSRKPRTANSS